MACTPAITADLASSATFYTWLNSQHAIADPLMASTRTQTAADVASLSRVAADLQAHNDCLTSLTGSVSAINTENSTKRATITSLTSEINDIRLDVQIAQDRALLTRHPEMSRSYYESILPIGRPMAHYTVPILIGISTFLLSLSFFMLLNIFSVDARLLIPMASSAAKNSYATPFWMMAGVAAILFGLVIYAYTK
jgi:hypothetical protein